MRNYKRHLAIQLINFIKIVHISEEIVYNR